MPTYKVLAQSAPSAATATTLYTATNATIVSTLNVSNTGGAADTIRIAVRPAGASLANPLHLVSHWLTQMLLQSIQLQELHPLVRSGVRVTKWQLI
jgi:hypothetical protein